VPVLVKAPTATPPPAPPPITRYSTSKSRLAKNVPEVLKVWIVKPPEVVTVPPIALAVCLLSPRLMPYRDIEECWVKVPPIGVKIILVIGEMSDHSEA
jgi:hypothetical protein